MQGGVKDGTPVSGLVSRTVSTLVYLFILGSPEASYLPTGSQPGLPLKTSLPCATQTPDPPSHQSTSAVSSVGAWASLRICWSNIGLVDTLQGEGGCPGHCGVLSSTPGPAHSVPVVTPPPPPSHDNQRCLQTLASVPGGQTCLRLRTV